MVAERLEMRSEDAPTTDELVALRWEHRETLRLIPASVLALIRLPTLVPVRCANPTAEIALREEARSYARVLERDLHRLRDLALAEAAVEVLASLDLPPSAPLAGTLASMVQRASARAITDLDELQCGADVVSEFVALTVVADSLAGDGYCDPRVGTAVRL
jgi:hypothetical protein